MRWAGHVARAQQDNIKTDIQEVGWDGMDRIDVAQDRNKMAGTYECGNEPSGSIKCGEFLDQLRNGQLLKKDSAAWGE